MMYRIVAPHFVAGIEPGVRAAPILAWMLRRRWTAHDIGWYCAKKGWQMQELRP